MLETYNGLQVTCCRLRVKYRLLLERADFAIVATTAELDTTAESGNPDLSVDSG